MQFFCSVSSFCLFTIYMSKVGKPKSGQLSERRRHPASTLPFFILQYLPSYQCLLSLSPVYYNGNLCLFLCCFLFEFSAILRRFSLLSLKLSTAVLDSPASSPSNVIFEPPMQANCLNYPLSASPGMLELSPSYSTQKVHAKLEISVCNQVGH